MAARNGFNRVLGARIRKARKSMPPERGRRVSQDTFAEKVGVHVVTVSQWERGKATPNMSNLLQISQVSRKPLEFFTQEDQGEEDEEEDEEDAVAALMKAIRAVVRAERRRERERAA